MEPVAPIREASIPVVPTVRWLAELCGVATPGIALPRLFTELLGEKEYAEKAQRYLSWWIRHADEGSSFDLALKPLSSAPDETLIQILQQRNYDGLCYLSEGEIVGHVFFQNHDAEICAFSAAVDPQFRGGKLWVLISLDFVAYAARFPAIRKASVGTGRNPVARHLIRLLAQHVTALGWQVTGDGWINFDTGNQTETKK